MTTTTDFHPALQEAFENLPEPGGLAKIVTQPLRDERGTLIGMAFARADTGMIIGAAQQGMSQFGHSPCIDQHYFTSQQKAEDYVRELCRIYLCREDVDFLVEEGDQAVSLSTPPRQRHRM